MVSQNELNARLQDFFRFGRQEVQGLAAAILVTAFIFSFRDWGTEQFNVLAGLQHFLLTIILATLAFAVKTSCQKIYGLSQGFKADFKVWWVGLIVALVAAFVSLGWVTLVLAGSMATAFMVKQRLGEFRYGFSYFQNAVLSFWGILGNLILATLMAVGLYFYPSSYFFSKGLFLNLVMALCALLPLPQLEGLTLFFGSRVLYYVAIGVVMMSSFLLWSKTKWGLILTIVLGAIAAIFYLLIGSEK